MALRCTSCGPFEANDGRCPQCLRRGSVVDANAPIPRDPNTPNPWLAIPLSLAMTVMGVILVGYGLWDLAERSASRA